MTVFSCFIFCRVASAREVWRPQSPQSTVGKYKLGRELGDGAFGTVSLAEHIGTKQKVAVKVVHRGSVADDVVDREIKLMRRSFHPHVVSLRDIITTSEGVSIVMELVPGGNLHQYLATHGKLHENEGRQLFQQLISAVEHCHACNVAHRDLKLENLLLDDEFNLKVADFGLAREMVNGEVLAGGCGSPNYAAPELLQRGVKRYQGAAADVYSCGVVLYALLCNHFPFQADNRQELFKLMKLGRYRVPGYLSTEVLDMLRLMITVSPSGRSTCPEIRDHAWFNADFSLDCLAAC